MVISIIACLAKNRAIGYQNRLLYHIPEDLHRFRDLTMGHTIIMGRKTFESLPHGALPHRRNIVLSLSQKEITGCEVFASLEDAIRQCNEDEEVFVIGGESIYQQSIDKASRLYLTVVNDTPNHADAFFPTIDYREWNILGMEHHTSNSLRYTFKNLSRHIQKVGVSDISGW